VKPICRDVDAAAAVNVVLADPEDDAAHPERVIDASGNHDQVESTNQMNVCTDTQVVKSKIEISLLLIDTTPAQNRTEKHGAAKSGRKPSQDPCTSANQDSSRSSLASLAAEIARQQARKKDPNKYSDETKPVVGLRNNRPAPQDRIETLNDVDINQQDEMTSTSGRPRNNLAILAAEVARKKMRQ